MMDTESEYSASQSDPDPSSESEPDPSSENEPEATRGIGEKKKA